MGDAADATQESLGIEGYHGAIGHRVGVHVRFADNRPIHGSDDALRRQIHASREAQKRPVENQNAYRRMQNIFVVNAKADERTETVGQGEALHDAKDTKVLEIREAVVPQVIEEVQSETDEENDDGTPDDFLDALRRPLEIILPEREEHRNAHDEHEERENEVGRREAVPLRVSERGIDVSPRARVVHENHSGDRDASHHVQRKESACLCH